MLIDEKYFDKANLNKLHTWKGVYEEIPYTKQKSLHVKRVYGMKEKRQTASTEG